MRFPGLYLNDDVKILEIKKIKFKVCLTTHACIRLFCRFLLRTTNGTFYFATIGRNRFEKRFNAHIIRCIKTISHENARPLPLRSRRLVFRRHTDVNESASDPAAAFCDLLQHELALLFVTHHWRISKTGTTQHHMPMGSVSTGMIES